ASGVGKSTLLNALVPGLDLRTAEVGRKGRHTTVSATMHPYGDRGYVVDTPGLQYLALWRVDPAELARAFPEFRPHVDRCRFGDCRHLAEPGCGVKEAVEAGEISGRRHESYRTLLEAIEEEREPGDPGP
ncbi:MAG: ribosome small subunit-dependent GTPase A, partial [Gemmatimonadota bacterium]